MEHVSGLHYTNNASVGTGHCLDTDELVFLLLSHLQTIQFPKYTGDPATLRTWLRKCIRAVSQRQPRAGQASNEDVLGLVAHPPRADGQHPPGFLAGAAADTAAYTALAASHPGAAAANQRALHASLQADIEVGATFGAALDGSSLEYLLDEAGDLNRFSALVYRIRVSVPNNIETEELEQRKLLIPTDLKGDGEVSPDLIKLNQQLPQKQQFADLKNRLLTAYKKHKLIMIDVADANDPRHITDATLIGRLAKLAKTIARFRGQVAMHTAVAQAATIHAALDVLISWDINPANEVTVDPHQQAAFNVQQIKWVQDANQARPVRDGVAAGGGSAGTYNPVGCYAQVYHLEGRSMKLNIPTQRNLSGGVVKCFNCLAQGHRVKDCTIPFGPHMFKANGAMKQLQRCYHDNCRYGADHCNMIHMDVPQKGKQHKNGNKGGKPPSEKKKLFTQMSKNFKVGKGGKMSINRKFAAQLTSRMNGKGKGKPARNVNLTLPGEPPEPAATGSGDDDSDSEWMNFHVVALSSLPPSETTTNAGAFKCVVDSGASLPGGCTHEFDDYIDFEACGATEHPVKTADGSITYIKGFGTVQVNVATSTGLQTIRLRKIAYLPSYKVKLLSHIQLLKEGCSFVDTRKGAYIQLENGTQIPLFKEHGLNKLIGAIDRQVFRDSLNPEKGDADSFDAHYQDVTRLKHQLCDEDVKSSVQKKTIIRLQLAKLGTYCASQPQTDKLLRLHVKLGHPSPRKLQEYIHQNYTKAKAQSEFGKVGVQWCDSCTLAKMVKSKRSTKEVPKAIFFGDKTFMDIAGKFKETALGTSYQYELIFVDSATSFITLYPIVTLDQVPSLAKRYLSWMMRTRKQHMAMLQRIATDSTEAPASKRLKSDLRSLEVLPTNARFDSLIGTRLQGDSAAVFTSSAMNMMCSELGVTLQHSAPYCQYANGVAERAWHSLHTRADAMRLGANLPYNTWWYSHKMAVTTHNALPCSSNANNMSPHERVYGDLFSTDKLRAFGETVFIRRQVRSKHESRGREGRYLGRNDAMNSHIVRVYSESSKRFGIVHTNDIRWKPFGLPSKVGTGEIPLEAPGYIPFDDAETEVVDEQTTSIQPHIVTIPATADQGHMADTDVAIDDEIGADDDETFDFVESATPFPNDLIEEEDVLNLDLYPEYQPKSANAVDASVRAASLGWTTQTQLHNSSPLDSPKVGDTYMSPAFAAHLNKDLFVHLAIGKAYSSPKKAFSDPTFGLQFKAADTAEFEQLLRWKIIELIKLKDVPPGEKIFPTIELFQMKGDDKGVPTKAKARLVLDGSSQGVGDTGETATFTPKWGSVRCLLSHAAAYSLLKRKLDIPNAFSQAKSHRVRYAYMPYGSKRHDKDGFTLAIKVIGNLYGGRDAGRIYQDEVILFLKELGFVQNNYDGALFYRASDSTTDEIWLTIWVDDVLFCCKTDTTAKWIESVFEKRWNSSKIAAGSSLGFGDADFFLGLNISETKKGIKLHAKAYIDTWKRELIDTKTITGKIPTPKTPLPPGYATSKAECVGEPQLKSAFKTNIAKIQWLATTCRPDVAYACHTLSKVAHAPSPIHQKMLKRLMAYVLTTAEAGVFYFRMPPHDARIDRLVAHSDSSHWDCPLTRRSTSGYTLHMNGGMVNWRSKTQPLITLSSCESELVACTDAVRDVLWARHMLSEQNATQHGATVVAQDNQSTIQIIRNPFTSISERSKHIHARYLWVHQALEIGEIQIVKFHTDDVIADALTKALGTEKFFYFRNLMLAS